MSTAGFGGCAADAAASIVTRKISWTAIRRTRTAYTASPALKHRITFPAVDTCTPRAYSRMHERASRTTTGRRDVQDAQRAAVRRHDAHRPARRGDRPLIVYLED